MVGKRTQETMMTATTRNMVAALAALLLVGACATDPETGQQTITRGGKGALAGGVGGALLGGLIGGNTGALIGAGVGSISGGAVGGYMDRQERELRAATANTPIEVVREGNEIALKLPDSISFDFNSAVVRPELRTELEQVATVLNAYPSTVIGIFGHTDNVGSQAVNQRLSEQRAQSVAGSLQSFGVPQARMQTQGFSFNQPVASNDTDEGRAKNRRVEIRIVPVTDQQVQG
jgi:outer membrane protein OmpA-like peptidoglycan-associated protein